MNPLIFTFQQLKVLLSQRDDNGAIIERFISNLAIATRKMEARTAEYKIDEHSASIRSKRRRFGLFSDIYYHWQQARKVMIKTSLDRPVRIFGIDPTRLELVEGNLQKQIVTHMSKLFPRLNKWSNSGDTCEVIMFDPKLDFGYRSVSALSDTPIMSPLATIFLTLQSPKSILSWPAAFRCGWTHLGPVYSSASRRIVSVLLLSLFLVGIQILIKRSSGKLALLCLTSNSVFLEALRARILADPCGEVDEIQHGIASPQFDPYFLSYKIALSSGLHGKFWIYPLLASPFCLSPVSSPQFYISDKPSNTGIYRSLIKLMSDTGSRPISQLGTESIPTLTKALKRNFSKLAENGDVIFAIFGGTDLGKNFYFGSAFQSEMSLAQVIYDRLSVKAHVQPVYLPHPANPPLSNIKFANGTPLQIFKHSQQIYFCADYAFSLYSSTIFEANAFGALSFCSMPSDTGVLHGSMLDELICPKGVSRKELDSAIAQFAELPSPSRDLVTKIDERLRRFFEGTV